ncbi:MAG: Cof-type HAD-IIB family hydrolase [Lachnospiraceae bacterium]|nr:Cof-type HAD-IIB family hydrolase [Lachnospiraceae bacterium]
MSKKVVFLDIDGTIWDEYNRIPESTITAIHQMQARGHAVFINSGRTRSFIREKNLLDIGFDGIVSGCGTMIEYHGEEIFYHEIPRDLAIHTVETVRACGLRPILEGKRYLYFDDDEFNHEDYGKKLIAEMGEDRLRISEHWGDWRISKLSCATDNADMERCQNEMGTEYDFMIHSSTVCEMVPKGFNKGTGIAKVCELLGVDIRDSYAFGDSVNDTEMMETAGHAIVMGNGTNELKAIADYVTKSLHEDGIHHGCLKMGLI